jgi:hypothetical protein
MKLMHHLLSLPGLTPKSGVPDFGAFRTAKEHIPMKLMHHLLSLPGLDTEVGCSRLRRV